jgi:hypothetical protein
LLCAATGNVVKDRSQPSSVDNWYAKAYLLTRNFTRVVSRIQAAGHFQKILNGVKSAGRRDNEREQIDKKINAGLFCFIFGDGVCGN